MAESSGNLDELESLLHADGEGPALPLSAAASQALVDQVLARAELAKVAPLRRRTTKLWWLLAAALLAGGSAAAMYAAQRERSSESAAAERTATPHLQRPAPPAAVQLPPEAAPPAVTTPEPAAVAAPAPAPKPAANDRAAASSNTPSRVQDLLRRANELRGAGDYRAAERMYLRVVTSGASESAAYSARVAAAGLRADRLGDPRGALALYRDALRAQPDGPLAPEIHEGMAQSFRKLGMRADERRALAALLASGTAGPAAERARQRLEELGGPRE